MDGEDKSMSTTSTSACYICGSSVRRWDEYVRCVSCGIVRTMFSYNPSLYSTKYAKNYVKYAATDVNIPLQLFRVGLISRWLKEGQKVLDIGCCVGEFIRFAEHYYECAGFEPNKEAARLARTRCTSRILSELNGSVGKAKVVTLFDVLEHIEDPRAFLQSLVAEYMEEDALLAITTPNVEAIPPWNDEGLRKWKHYKPQEHLFLFTEAGLTQLSTDCGMEVIHVGHEESDIRPGNPDGDILTFVAKRKL